MNWVFKIVILQFLIISQMAAGQKIIRSSLGCFGSTYADDGFIFCQTAGQSSATDVLKNDAIILRQGFQQPLARGNTSIYFKQPGFSISPNPAKNTTQIRFQEEMQECTVIVRDMNGNPIFESREEYIRNKWLDISALKPGIYIVTIIGANAAGSEKIIVTR